MNSTKLCYYLVYLQTDGSHVVHTFQIQFWNICVQLLINILPLPHLSVDEKFTAHMFFQTFGTMCRLTQKELDRCYLKCSVTSHSLSVRLIQTKTFAFTPFVVFYDTEQTLLYCNTVQENVYGNC